MAKVKAFCKWKDKDIARGMNLIVKLTDQPTYVCKKCARVANTKKAICKPASLPKFENRKIKSLSVA